jgi:hypothetical protein
MQRLKQYLDRVAQEPVTTVDLLVLVVAYSIGTGLYQVLFNIG